MTMYSVSNRENKPMRAFAAEVGLTSNKILDYLREKDVLYLNNDPCPDYEDWFQFHWPVRYDLTPHGESMVRKMIETDGIDYVNGRKVIGDNRKGKWKP